MRRKKGWITGLVLILVCGVGFGQDAQNPAFAEVKDEPSLPRVLLIGDSISIGYTQPVREFLKGIANVHRIPTNGGPTIRGWDRLDEWLSNTHWDVIHFNWGLHDLKIMEDGFPQVPLDYYELILDRLTQRLKATGARLIWASTTPVPHEKVSPSRKPSDVIAYNQAAEKVMKKYQVPIDDLYGVALSRLKEIQQPANVHFTETGYQALAEQVAKEIRAVLGK